MKLSVSFKKRISNFFPHLKYLYLGFRVILYDLSLYVELSSTGQHSQNYLLSLPWVESSFSVVQLWSQALLRRHWIMSGPLGVPVLLSWVSACLWLSWQAQGALIISGIPKSLVNNNFSADFKTLYSSKFLDLQYYLTQLSIILSSLLLFFNLRRQMEQPDYCRYLNFQTIQFIIL